MTPELIVSIGSALASLGAVVFSYRKATADKRQAELVAREELGRRYAVLALDATANQSLPADLRKRAELDCFRIIDLDLDGQRDFTDAQAEQYLEAERKRRT